MLTPAQAKREADTLPKRKLNERRRVMVRYTGKSLCTWCLTPVTGRRSTWCSDACVDAFFMVHDWKQIRAAVLARDKGVCRQCSRDTQKAYEVYLKIIRHAYSIIDPRRGWFSIGTDAYILRSSSDPRVQRWLALAIKLATDFGFGATQSAARDWWEADHIVERVRGGRDHLDNLRTLCLRCHKVETARLARERADERRARIPLSAQER